MSYRKNPEPTPVIPTMVSIVGFVIKDPLAPTGRLSVPIGTRVRANDRAVELRPECFVLDGATTAEVQAALARLRANHPGEVA